MNLIIIILIIGSLIFSFFTICIFIGSNKNKSDYEKMIEDQEQIEYLKKYSKNKKI